MALSTAEKLLLDGLQLFPMQRGNLLLTMLLMKTDTQRWELIDFLVNTQNATETQILDEAHRIAKM